MTGDLLQQGADIAGDLMDQGVELLPDQFQAPATEARTFVGETLGNAWDGVANIQDGLASGIESSRLGQYLGETGSNIAAWAAMGFGALMTLRIGSFLTDTLTQTFTGASSGLVNGIGSIAMTVGLGILANNYMNGTGPFAQNPQMTNDSGAPNPNGTVGS